MTVRYVGFEPPHPDLMVPAACTINCVFNRIEDAEKCLKTLNENKPIKFRNMSLQIFKRELGQNKETIIRATNEESYEQDLCKVLEQMEDNCYVQCEASGEEINRWDNEFKDWMVVCDSEFEDDRTLIYVK